MHDDCHRRADRAGHVERHELRTNVQATQRRFFVDGGSCGVHVGIEGPGGGAAKLERKLPVVRGVVRRCDIKVGFGAGGGYIAVSSKRSKQKRGCPTAIGLRATAVGREVHPARPASATPRNRGAFPVTANRRAAPALGALCPFAHQTPSAAQQSYPFVRPVPQSHRVSRGGRRAHLSQSGQAAPQPFETARTAPRTAPRCQAPQLYRWRCLPGEV